MEARLHLKTRQLEEELNTNRHRLLEIDRTLQSERTREGKLEHCFKSILASIDKERKAAGEPRDMHLRVSFLKEVEKKKREELAAQYKVVAKVHKSKMHAAKTAGHSEAKLNKVREIVSTYGRKESIKKEAREIETFEEIRGVVSKKEGEINSTGEIRGIVSRKEDGVDPTADSNYDFIDETVEIQSDLVSPDFSYDCSMNHEFNEFQSTVEQREHGSQKPEYQAQPDANSDLETSTFESRSLDDLRDRIEELKASSRVGVSQIELKYITPTGDKIFIHFAENAKDQVKIRIEASEDRLHSLIKNDRPILEQLVQNSGLKISSMVIGKSRDQR